VYRCIILILLISVPLPLYAAEESVADCPALTSVLTAAENPWGRFKPSSWILMQTAVVQTNAEGIKTRSTSEKKTILDSVEKDGFTLVETDTVNFGGQQVQKAPVIRKFDFFQQPAPDKLGKTEDKIEINAGEPEKLVVDRLLIPCEKRVYQQETPSGKYKTTVWYSSQVYPYIFRIEKVQRQETEGQPPVVISQSVSEVQNLSVLPLRRGRSGSCRYRTIRKSGNITTVIETTNSANVPGGIIKETIREFDQTGKEIRFSESRLINYFAAADSAVNRAEPQDILIYDKSRLRLKKRAD
jgi:hypothetical protein